MSENDSNDGRSTTAYVLIAIAIYFVLSRTGMLELMGISGLLSFIFKSIYYLIPVGCIAVGILWINAAKDESVPILAWFAIILGALLIISRMKLFGLSFGALFLPLWLIFIATILLKPRSILPKSLSINSKQISDDATELQLLSFMGGGQLVCSSRKLLSGEIGAIFGGYKIDLSEADMNEDTMVLSLFCIMGGVEILVPPNWEVENKTICIMGGISNKARCIAEKLELPRKRLIVKGFAFMGGGEFRN